LNKPINP